MRIRHFISLVAAAAGFCVFWNAYRLLTLKGDEAGLLVPAMLGVIILAVMVGWPLLVMAVALSLPERLRVRRRVRLVAAAVCAAPVAFSGGAWRNLVIGISRAGGLSPPDGVAAAALAFPLLLALFLLFAGRSRHHVEV
jgi:hypothetical protein